MEAIIDPVINQSLSLTARREPDAHSRGPWLPHQKRILEEQLTKLELTAISILYHLVTSPQGSIGKGEMLVDARD